MASIPLDFLLNATGNLANAEAAQRFRASIEDEETVGADDLERWIETCLTKSGQQYNFALQDIVNAYMFSVQMGIFPCQWRLGFGIGAFSSACCLVDVHLMLD